MADDITTLGIEVDSRPVDKGKEALDKLAQAGAKAEKATEDLTSATKILNKALGESEDTNRQNLSATERFVAALKKEADTIGMATSQLRSYEAAQLKLNAAQRASVDASIKSLEAHEKNKNAANQSIGVLGGLKSAYGLLAGAVAALGLGRILSESTSRSLEFSKSLAQISTQIDGSVDDLDRLSNSAKRLSAEFGTLPVDQTKAFYEIISAGISDVNQATELLSTANRLAIGGNTTLATSVDGLTNIMNSYAGKVVSAEAVSDALFVAMKAGKATMEELSSSLGRVTPLASTLNVSFDELVATVGALSKQGISTAESVTGVRAILASVAKPTKEASDLAEKLGLEFNAAGLQAKGFGGFLSEIADKTKGSADKLAVLFGGVEALVPIMALSGQAGKDFTQIMQDMGTKAGSTQDAFDKMAASPGFKIDKLMASMSNIAITLGDAFASVLAPAAEKASIELNRLFGVGQNMTAIEKQKKMLSDLQSELDSLNNRKHIPIIGDLIFDKKQADLLEQRIEDGIGDLKKLEDEAIAAAKSISEVPKLPKINPSAGGGSSNSDLKARKSELDKLNKAQQESLRIESEYIKLLQIERKQQQDLIAPYKEGAKQAADRLNSMQDEIAALKLVRDRQISMKQAVELTTIARLEEKKAKATDSLVLKEIDAEIAARRKVIALIPEYEQLENRSHNAANTVSQQWIQAGRNIQTALANSIFDYFNSGLDSMVQNVKTAVLRIMAEFAALKISQYLGLTSYFGGSGGTGVGGLLSTGGSLASLFGGGGSVGGASGLSALSMAQLGSNATGLLRTGFGATGLTAGAVEAIGSYYGSAYLSAFGAGMNGVGSAGAAAGIFSNAGGAGTAFIGGPGTALGGTGMGTAASMGATFGTGIATAGAAALGVTLGSLIAGDKRIMGMSGATTSSIGAALGGAAGVAVGAGGGVAAGAAAGSVVPVIGTIIGAIIGGIVAAGFGHGPMKFRQQSLQGEVSSGGIDGSLTNVFRAKGGWFVGNKHKSFDTDIPDKLDNLIDKTITGYYKSAHKFAENLGFSTDLVDNYTQQIQIKSEKGKQITEEQVKTIFEQLANNIATNVIPTIDQYALIGEKAGDTFARLNTEFVSLTSGVQNLGASVAYSKELIRAMDINDRTELIDSAGGIERVSQLTSAFFDGFLSNSEKLSVRTDQLNTALSALNISTDVSVDQFKALIQSTDTANDLRIALLDLAPALLAVRDAAEQAKAAANQNTLKLAQEFAPQLVVGLQRDMANEVLGKFGVTVDTSREKVTELLTAFVKSGGLFSSMADDVMEAAEAWSGFQQLIAQTPASVSAQALPLEKQAANALAILTQSVDKERNKLAEKYNDAVKVSNDRIAAVTESVAKLKNASEMVRQTVNDIIPMSLEQARSQIANGAADSSNLADALNVLRNQNDTSGFSNVLEFRRSQGQNANILTKFSNSVENQLTLEQRSLAALESARDTLDNNFKRQNDNLDQLIIDAQAQVEHLKGIYTNTMELPKAIGEFNRIIAQGGQQMVGGGAVSGGSPGSKPPVSGNLDVSSADIVGYITTHSYMESYKKARELGVTSAQIAATGIFSQQQINDWVKQQNLASFDVGGRVPKTGIAMIHKDEQILTKSQSDDMNKTLAMLVTTVQALTISNNQMKRIFQTWDGNGMPPVREVDEAA